MLYLLCERVSLLSARLFDCCLVYQCSVCNPAEFIGEETFATNGTPELTYAPTWIVYPLGRTTNFVHRYSFVCVSIGLVIEKVPTVGVGFNPILDEGAFLNGQHIYASEQQNIGNALLATEVGKRRDKETIDVTTNKINNLLFEVHSLHLCGSCAMNLCGVACRRLDLFYELGFGGPWDVAVGALILQEAGGHVFDPSGSQFNMMSQWVAASDKHLKQALLEGLKGLI
ncbi:hypothetical protein CY35_11G107700 [Sphagnum magellanicum]|nr:hypothetical protein CY35_11G107700 [Sphagnum magellanicum]